MGIILVFYFTSPYSSMNSFSLLRFEFYNFCKLLKYRAEDKNKIYECIYMVVLLNPQVLEYFKKINK